MQLKIPKILLICLLLLAISNVTSAQIKLKTKSFSIELDKEGMVKNLFDLESNCNYAPEESKGVLLSIKKGDEVILPRKCYFKNNTIYLRFPDKSLAEIAVEEKDQHLTFELVKITPEQAVDAIIWGPFNTTIGETIGEIVGVVRNADFAIGIQSLNAKTTGGVLTNDEGAVYKIGSTAVSQDFGSSLQAFCINRNKQRKVKVWRKCDDMPLPAIKEAALPGSKIAIFGVKTKEALTTIGEIEIAEGLPHPEINGTWIKKSPETGRAYMIASFNEDNIDEMLEYAERMGMMSLYHEHPFENWGHFDLIAEQFPNGREGMKKCVEKGLAKNINVGVHTLTNFITTNDPFITPIPHKNLAVSGSCSIGKSISSTDDEIYVLSPKYFTSKSDLQSVKIGDEIIRYQSVTSTSPYKLTGCVRGAFNTIAKEHASGSTVSKLVDHPYKVFFPNWEMQKEMIDKMADFFNETGVNQMDFDGHEGAFATGMGDYSMDYFAEQFLEKVNHSVVNGSSRSKHYYWHVNNYLNWGEPWYGGFRESMSDYRFEKQPMLERNYMPNMLGWFLLTATSSVEDIEWMMARSAGYNAGYAFVARYEPLKSNPDTDKIIKQIRLWEDAKKSKIFNEDQKVRLKNPNNEFHLSKAGEKWMLQNFTKNTFEHENVLLQPGQPTYSEWMFVNNEEAQPISLHLLLKGEKGEINNINIEVDNFFELKIQEPLASGSSLVWNGDDIVKIYNKKGRLQKEIKTEKTMNDLRKGQHTIVFNCEFSDDSDIVINATVKLKGDIEVIE